MVQRYLQRVQVNPGHYTSRSVPDTSRLGQSRTLYVQVSPGHYTSRSVPDTSRLGQSRTLHVQVSPGHYTSRSVPDTSFVFGTHYFFYNNKEFTSETHNFLVGTHHNQSPTGKSRRGLQFQVPSVCPSVRHIKILSCPDFFFTSFDILT